MNNTTKATRIFCLVWMIILFLYDIFALSYILRFHYYDSPDFYSHLLCLIFPFITTISIFKKHKLLGLASIVGLVSISSILIIAITVLTIQHILFFIYPLYIIPHIILIVVSFTNRIKNGVTFVFIIESAIISNIFYGFNLSSETDPRTLELISIHYVIYAIYLVTYTFYLYQYKSEKQNSSQTPTSRISGTLAYSNQYQNQTAANYMPSTVPAVNANNQIENEILRYKYLYDQGLITGKEFEQKRRQILGI